MIYYKGCTVREKLNNISKSTETLLNRANIEYTILKDERCCGSFLLRTGFIDDATQVMRETVKELQNETILVSCAGCYKSFKKDYKEILGIELDVVHSSQFFNNLISEGKLKVKKINKKVTYHDPCHLGRHCGEFETPRKLLKQIVDLVEMENNGEKSVCCGSGGGLRALNPELSQVMAENRLNEALKTNCDFLSTSCSFCNMNLKSIHQSKAQILDISEIVVMGLENEKI